MKRFEKTQTILITGATGFIGSLLVKEIANCGVLASCAYDGSKRSALRLILLVRNAKMAKQQLVREIENRSMDIILIEAAVETLKVDMIKEPIDYILHCASVTKSSEMISHPVEVADGIALGTKNVLELAKYHRVKSMVYLSSMEVYGNVVDTGVPLSEQQLGDVSLSSVRSCYPMAKRMAEHYCHIYHREYGVSVKIARLAQTFGIGIKRNDTRVFVQFAKAVIEQRDIILHTTGMSMGNYCESEDAVRAIFMILQKGVDGEAYNVVNESNTMRIGEMAELVATGIAEGKITVRYELDDSGKGGYAEDTGLRLSAAKLRRLGWQPTKDLEAMYRDLIAELLEK